MPRVVRKFKTASGPNVLLVSLKCGGVGLNLVEANRVIWCVPPKQGITGPLIRTASLSASILRGTLLRNLKRTIVCIELASRKKYSLSEWWCATLSRTSECCFDSFGGAASNGVSCNYRILKIQQGKDGMCSTYARIIFADILFQT